MSHHSKNKKLYLGSGVTSALVVLSVVFFAPACGLNAHTTRGKGIGSATRPADAIVATEDPGSQGKSGEHTEASEKSTVSEESSKSNEGSSTENVTSEKTEEHASKSDEGNATDNATSAKTEEHASKTDEGQTTEGKTSEKTEEHASKADEGNVTDSAKSEKTEDHAVSKAEPREERLPVIIVEKGEKGEKGADGISTCGIERRSVVLMAAAPKVQVAVGKKDALKRAYEDLAKSMLLPYVSTKAHKIELLPVGGSNKIDAQSNVYVENALTLMSFDVSLPAFASTTIRRADLVLAVRKTNSDLRTDTEVLCLNDERICSGKLFDTKGWMDLINKSYFTPDTYTEPKNEAFSQALTDEMNKKYLGRKIWANDQLTLSLSNLLAGSKMEGQVKELLYAGSTDDKSAAQRTLNVVVGDDTYVREAKLVLEYDEDTCISGKRN